MSVNHAMAQGNISAVRFVRFAEEPSRWRKRISANHARERASARRKFNVRLAMAREEYDANAPIAAARGRFGVRTAMVLEGRCNIRTFQGFKGAIVRSERPV